MHSATVLSKLAAIVVKFFGVAKKRSLKRALSSFDHFSKDWAFRWSDFGSMMRWAVQRK